MENKIRVSCVIASYNEQDRIGNVLDIISNHPLIDEVIVVDDGSTDNTRNILSRFENIKTILHTKNSGKSMSIHDGLKETRGEFICLIDADLLGLTTKNVTDLIQPVLDSRADVAISLRINSPILWRLIGIDYISGERVLPKKLFVGQYENISKLRGFGLEVFMNKLIINNKYNIKIVPWDSVHSPEKYLKYGVALGIKREMGMFIDIFKTISLYQIIKQIYTLRRSRITS